MGRSSLRLVSVGESTLDHYVDLQTRYVGGISLNFAVQSKRSGAEKVALVSRVGEDQDGRVQQVLAREGVDISHLKTMHGKTARQDILLTWNGERVFPPGGYDPGVLENFKLNEEEMSFVQSHDVIASGLFKQVEPLFEQMMEMESFEGWRVADFLDLSDYGHDIGIIERFSKRLKIAFVSGDKRLLEGLRTLSKSSDCLIVVTLGKHGSAALIKGESVYQASLPVENILDSTGCGDAFQAAFTVSYWRDTDVQRALSNGAQQAAGVLQHYGAI
ncbi:MAG TPA: PfkB family carbohydrate kinase [Acidobacteriota bacterium]|nr:PfkB family carbohydrate kinase [Acidobacteriota bacterium]